MTNLLEQYGYIILYIALTMELIAFPTPGETLMTYCGYMVFSGKLNLLISICISASGCITGITISYFIGKTLGKSFFLKYGHKIHLGPEKLEKTSKWFEKYGNGLLMVAYFIPGIRHITGYFSGITKVPYKKFVLNAYIGAFIWTSTFITLGRVLGANWKQYEGPIKKYFIIGSIIIGFILLFFYLYKNHKEQIRKRVYNSLGNTLVIFNSMGRIRITVSAISLVFIGLIALVIGLTQDFLANEFNQFNEITKYIIDNIFPIEWTGFFTGLSFITSFKALIAMTVIMGIWIIVKKQNRFLELRFLLITFFGGEVLEESLRRIYYIISPVNSHISRYSFPSEQTLMAIVTYGFAAFILWRHTKKHWFGTIVTIAVIMLCLLIGISRVYLGRQNPSDISAGFVFGGVWLSLNIILLEVYRILPKISNMLK